jgi:hypothetical protein
MTETELKELDRTHPYKAVQTGVIGTVRFNCPTEARKHFEKAKTTCLLTSYVGGVFKHMDYKHKI